MIYDRFQQEAMAYITQGYSVIVSAPTGAGKTVVAEHVIQDCLNKGEKVIYTAPIKALSNQKFREFQDNAPDQVGILTGDVSINPTATVLIMTTEIFRNKILEERTSLNAYSWIIFDEIHYLDDYERGSVWEESLIFLPEHMKLLGLSATIPNIDQLAQWIESIHHRPIKVVKESNRPVPLHFFYNCQGEIYDDFKILVKKGFDRPEAYDRRREIPEHARIKGNNVISLIKRLADDELLPCIYFVFSRRRTEILAEEIHGFDFLNSQEKQEITGLFDRLCARYDLRQETSAHQLRRFIEKGIGYHHAGMLPTLKEVVEQLFTSRLLKVIFTTETFALGINMPARTVVFDELRKYYGYGYGPLRTRDFYQMAGRAGRRSMDTEGFVFSRINPHQTSSQELHRIVYGQPEKVNSQFDASYATILNLYQKYGDKLYEIYPLSFHYYQVRPYLRKKAVELMQAKVALLKEMGHIKDGSLTEKGIFASKIYGYELVLSELYDQGMLEGLSPNELAVLSLSVVYEPRKGTVKPPLSSQAKSLETLTKKIKRQIHKTEARLRMRNLSKRCYFHLTPALEAWMKGATFDAIMPLVDVDEGEIVRYFRMGLQVVREIAETPVSANVKTKIRHIIHCINRDVVDSEKQLRG